MLDQSTRTAILRLREEGHGARAIARVLKVSRGAVKDVFASGSEAVPHLVRVELAEPLRDDILALYASCKGNLVRVHEELTAKGATLSYQALTGFCRRHAIGRAPTQPAGRYEFEPASRCSTTPRRTSPPSADAASGSRAPRSSSATPG